MIDEYAQFSFDQVGPYALEVLDSFEGLRPQIKKAGLGVSLPEYVSMMIFSTLAAFLFSTLLAGLVMALSMGVAGLVLGLVIGIIASVGTFVGFYIAPSLLVNNRSAKIRDTMPFATMYLSTLAGTGNSLPEIFKNLADVEEYGEVSKEAEKIARDLDTFGMDITEALRRAAERTPSEDFEELMWGMNHVLTTGGSLRDFLRQRSGRLMNDYRRRVEEFADTLSLMVEMYIVLVIVGSIIFTSLSAVISTFVSQEALPTSVIVVIQAVFIFIGLPLISGMFVIMVEGASPGGIR
ncbi:MAG: type II secretion system F family protein [Candidatus Nanohaloarchaea archaeon]